MKKHVFLLLVIIVAISSCKSLKKEQRIDALASHIDSTVKPGDNFFLFANGKWFRQHPIHASEACNGIDQLREDIINEQILRICETSTAIKNPQKGSIRQKIGDFFYSGMDSITLNKKGISEVTNYLSTIGSIKDIDGVIKTAAFIQSNFGSALFDFGVGEDEKINSRNAVYFEQGGLSLPDRCYYFDPDHCSRAVRKEFLTHLGNVFEILGYGNDHAKAAARRIMTIETILAGNFRAIEDTRDPWSNYHKMSFLQFREHTPNINWGIFMDCVGLHNVDSVIVRQPEFFIALDKRLKSCSIESWRNYLPYHLIKNISRYVDDKTYHEFFCFYAKTLYGMKEPMKRESRVADQTNEALGNLIGRIYVDECLPKGTKEKLTEIGNSVKSAFADRIRSLDWMSSQTKEKALNKLIAIEMKVGYPDKWRDHSSLQIDRSSFLQNRMNVSKWEFDYMISQYGKPVDRNKWSANPQSYENTEYYPSNNSLCIPACNIIIPGYEQKMPDDAILYSVIGTAFGHEMTHGFDDQGCQYNAQGNLQTWWTSGDSLKFYSKTKKIIDQFGQYIVIDGLHINGELTQGENIADLGGAILAFKAFEKTDQYRSCKVIDGMTPAQRFFLGYALSNMLNECPEYLVTTVKSDEHSPAKFRVNGPLSNMSEFYEAFGVKKGDSMWVQDDQRVKIW